MQHRVILLAVRLAALTLMSYGLLYFSYKYYNPWFGGDDFLFYYKMYEKPLDTTVTWSPFIYRQVEALLVNMIFNAGVYYPAQISFSDPAYDQRLFFAALVTNYGCLILTALIIGVIVEHEIGRPSIAYPLLAGSICLLSFHVQVHVITGLTEGVTWLFMAIGFLLYVHQRGRALTVLVLLLSIFQRELIAPAFAAIAGIALALRRGNHGYNIFVLAVASVCFAAYVVMRTYVLPVPGFPEQLSPTYLVQSLLAFRINKDFLIQGLLTQNVVLLAILVSGFEWVVLRSIHAMLTPLLLTLLILVGICIAENIDNNVGRIVGMLTPLFAALCGVSLYRLDVGAGRSVT